jgi:5-methyltetrahydrofolate--homocysteine methyltransferase
MTRTERFLARLRAGQVLLADGATGTFLQSQDLPCAHAPERCLLEDPDQVLAMHRAYLAAGSDVILTDSFGGTHFRLAPHGLGQRVMEVNRLAAELAREAAGDGAVVVGDMGPTGQLLAPLGKVTEEQVAAAYAEQAAGLVAGGVDVLLVETMSDLGEARAAIEGVRSVTDLPLFCTFSFDTRGRSMMGVRPAQVARDIGPLVTGFGANCGADPLEFPGFLKAMRQVAAQALLWAKPNAGLPHMREDGRVSYDATPQSMAEIARQMVEAGAQIVGGCCGTAPAHIAAMAEALKRSPVEAGPRTLE